VQLIERFDSSATNHWNRTWLARASLTDWTLVPYVYHEGVAVLEGNSVHLWDPTDACWIDDKATAGYAALQAVRICPAIDGPALSQRASLLWTGREVRIGAWTALTKAMPERGPDRSANLSYQAPTSVPQ
jgi:hypothetical protein